jgi:type IV secretion system protein VirB10
MSTTPPPPPPPEDPYPSFPGDTNGNGNGQSELDQGRPGVASSPGRVMAVAGIVGAVLLFLFYNIFFSSKKPAEDANKGPDVQIAAPVQPPAPPVEPPIFQPPPVPEPTNVPLIKPEDDSAARAQLRQRLHSQIFIADNTSGISGLLGGGDTDNSASTDTNMQFQNQVTRANTKAQRVKATFIGDLNRTIAQGRLIQATLESAINTDLPAPIRAIVSRDTYGESGTEPLIPKGSRLIGQYSTDLVGGQSRVFVVWTRVIRPDGIDVMINSPLVDQIGQAGIGGQVDTKFQQIFSRSLLASIVTIGFAIGSDKITPGDGQTSTTSSTFGTTQSGNAASTATVNALNQLGTTTAAFLQRFINVKATILVDQGTPVNVFVNRDLIFPSELVGAKLIN